MPINVFPIDDAEADSIAQLEEGHFVDLKSRDISPAKLTRSMSGFANADGGELFIGIENDGTWRGFASPEGANGHLQAFESLFPLGEYEYEFLRHTGRRGIVLHALIFKSRDIKRATDGQAYVRRGAQNLPVATQAALRLLERAKGITSHEAATLPYAATELSSSKTIQEFVKTVVPTTTSKRWLEKQQLIVKDRPTVAGTVLFHDEPQVHLPKASIKIYRYAISAAEGTRETLEFNPIAIEGCLYQVIKQAVAETVRLVEEIRLATPEGLTRIKYPHETLHEIITNGALHRDYALNDDVHVRIFDNRVEVESPGRLPAHITPQNILTERFARNPGLVRLINKFPDPPNKDVGEGLNTAFAAMKKLQLANPEILERENSVLVLIRHQNLASPASKIVQYLEAYSTINNSKARELTSIDSEGQVRAIFRELISMGEIEKVPGTIKGGTMYRRKRKDARKSSPAETNGQARADG